MIMIVKTPGSQMGSPAAKGRAGKIFAYVVNKTKCGFAKHPLVQAMVPEKHKLVRKCTTKPNFALGCAEIPDPKNRVHLYLQWVYHRPYPTPNASAYGGSPLTYNVGGLSPPAKAGSNTSSPPQTSLGGGRGCFQSRGPQGGHHWGPPPSEGRGG